MTFPKFQYIRSFALLKACRALPCTHCGIEDGTVCAAHSNQAKHGKGRSIKASDIYVASLCARCHTTVDQSMRLTREQREQMWNNAHVRTVCELDRLALWPAGVVFPDDVVKLLKAAA